MARRAGSVALGVYVSINEIASVMVCDAATAKKRLASVGAIRVFPGHRVAPAVIVEVLKERLPEVYEELLNMREVERRSRVD